MARIEDRTVGLLIYAGYTALLLIGTDLRSCQQKQIPPSGSEMCTQTDRVEIHRVGSTAMLRALGPVKQAPGHPPPVIKRRVLGHLLLANGRMCPYDELIESIWGDDPNGGPLCARESLCVAVFDLRRRGVPIVTHYTQGYSLAVRIV